MRQSTVEGHHDVGQVGEAVGEGRAVETWPSRQTRRVGSGFRKPRNRPDGPSNTSGTQQPAAPYGGWTWSFPVFIAGA